MSSVDVNQLAELAALHQMQLPGPQLQQLARYCELLWDWNQHFNLTRHTTVEKFVTRDLLDSIELAKLIDSKEKVLDVGSGGGVPGIVLGIMRPDLQITLTESVGKKVRVLEDLVEKLNLGMAVHQARAEQVLPNVSSPVLVARAVGPLWKICRWFQPHWSVIKRVLAIKGSQWVQERHEARQRGLLQGVQLRRTASYCSPATGANHVILKLWSKALPETGPTLDRA